MGCGTSKLELSDAEAVAGESVADDSRGSLQVGLSTPVLDDSDKSVPLLKDTAPTKRSEVIWTRQIDPDADEDLPDLPDLPSQGSWTILEHVTRNEREESQDLKASSRVRTKLKVTKLSGCTLINQYLVVQFLGRGTSGRVYLCMDILEMKLCAIKIVKKNKSKNNRRHYECQDIPRDASTVSGRIPDTSSKPSHTADRLINIQREIAAMRKAGHHLNLVGLREVVDDESSNKLLLVMDYWEGGPIMSRSALERGRRIPEPVAKRYFRDLASGLARLHEIGIIHGDLKPENALMSADGRVALSDFGCSRSYIALTTGNDEDDDFGAFGDANHDFASSPMRCNGTPAFLAPELMRPFKERPSLATAGRAADVYALGTSLFACIYGRIPFAANSVANLFHLVKTQPLMFPDDLAVSPELIDLLNGMLAKDADHRLTLPAIQSHPWMSVDEDEVRNSGLNGLVQGVQPQLVQHVDSVDEWLFKQGEAGDALYFIVSGTVDVWYTPLQAASSRPNSAPGHSNAPEKQEYAESQFFDEGEKGKEQEQQGQTDADDTQEPKLWTPSRRSSWRLTVRRERSETPTLTHIPPLSLGGRRGEEDSPIMAQEQLPATTGTTATAGLLFSTSVRSAVTTPATTPIPSARSLAPENEPAVQNTSTTPRAQSLHTDQEDENEDENENLDKDGGVEALARRAAELLQGVGQTVKVKSMQRYRIAIRGQGEFLGETPFVGGENTLHPVSARTRNAMIMKIPYPAVKEYCQSDPVAKQKLAELAWKRQSEIIVLESLLRVAGAGADTEVGL